MPLLSASPYAILPFIVEDSTATLNRDNSVTVDLKVHPEDPDSPKVRYAVRKINGLESPREIIEWAHSLRTLVFAGMGATTGPGMMRVLEVILEGAPRFLCMNNSRMYANGNKVRRVQAADPDPTSISYRDNHGRAH